MGTVACQKPERGYPDIWKLNALRFVILVGFLWGALNVQLSAKSTLYSNAAAYKLRWEVDPVRYRKLSFEPLKEEDLPVLYSWLRESHVREFYHKKCVPCWEETRAKYLRRLNPDWPTRCFLSYVGSPMGYIQTYRVADYPEYAAMIGEGDGISVDLFIGDAGYVGNGWGRLILLKFLNEVAFPLFRAEDVCWIYHDRLNHRALRASRAVGFRHVRDFTEEGDLKELLVLHRDEAAARVARMAHE